MASSKVSRDCCNQEIEVFHSSHEHPLFLGRTQNESEICNLCLKTIDYVAFTCYECGFLLHKKCWKLPQEMEHDRLHPLHPLVLVPNCPDSPKSFMCSLCEKACSAFVFRCNECDFNVDVSCFLRTQATIGLPLGQKTRKIHHPSHQHGLLLHYVGEKNSMGRCCKGCNTPVFGPTYYCDECPEFLLHKSCSQFPKTIQHPFHPPHPLILHTKSPYPSGNAYCNACKKDISKGFVFHCSKCNFDLDLTCASQLRSVRNEKHNEHPLAFYEKIGCVVTCSVCKEMCQEYLYRCIACKFDAHDTCLPFASIVKHKDHQHPLSLKESIIKGDSDWFPCEVCKKRITSRHRLYYCEDCSYGVHIECMESEDLLDLTSNLARTLEDIDKFQGNADAFVADMKAEVEALWMKQQSLVKKYAIQSNVQPKLKDRMMKM